MKERGIIFSDAMVRAIIDGTKTCTRRVVKMPNWIKQLGGSFEGAFPDKAFGVTPCLQVPCTHPDGDTSVQRLRNPWMWPEPGRLWVREAWQAYEPQTRRLGGSGFLSGAAMRVYARPVIDGESLIEYRADKDLTNNFQTWRSPIHMPRWASRITLEVTNVRVERLLDITNDDALAEGILPVEGNCGFSWQDGKPTERPCCECCDRPVERFSDLWQKINGKTYPWHSNPWVWVIEFTKL